MKIMAAEFLFNNGCAFLSLIQLFSNMNTWCHRQWLV